MMKPGEILYSGRSEKSTPYIVRLLDNDDAENLQEYINSLSDEHTYITLQGEQMTLSQEKEYVSKAIEQIQNQTALYLVAFAADTLIAECSIKMKARTSSHEGVLGLTVSKEFRGQGVGSKLLDIMLEAAPKHIKKLKLITLGVFGNNPGAIALYTERGFKEHGRTPNGVYHKGEYVDHIYMHKFVRPITQS